MKRLRIFCLAALSLPGLVYAQSSTTSEQTEYVLSLIRQIERAWIFPKGSTGKMCKIGVVQAADGEVHSVTTLECESKELAESVREAVYRASPLPLPANPALFNAKLELTFIVPERK